LSREKPDLSTLAPQTMASHLANPRGEVGIAVAERLNVTNAGLHARCYTALDLQPGDRVVEIGFGNGHLIPDLLSINSGLIYVGIDISDTMVREATVHNADAIAEGRVSVHVADSSQIPLSTASFDRALTLNTIYFWDDPKRDLAEIRRVLCPGGRLVIGANTPESAMGSEFFRYGFRFYEEGELRKLVSDGGFARVDISSYHHVTLTPEGKQITRKYHIVIAE